MEKVLEQAYGQYPDPKNTTSIIAGKGTQFSGIKVDYDSSKPFGSKVINITRADGTPISDQTLKVATNDFMMTGGDGFQEFVDAGEQLIQYQ